MRHITVAFGSLLFLGAGCTWHSSKAVQRSQIDADALAASANEQQKKSQDDPQDRIVCEHEQIVGSHFPKLVCRTLRNVEQTRNDSQEFLYKQRACTDCRGD